MSNIFHGPVFTEATVKFDNDMLHVGGSDPSNHADHHDVHVRLRAIDCFYACVPCDDTSLRAWTVILNEGFKFVFQPASELHAAVAEDAFAAWRRSEGR